MLVKNDKDLMVIGGNDPDRIECYIEVVDVSLHNDDGQAEASLL